jgi:hypothetical protein
MDKYFYVCSTCVISSEGRAKFRPVATEMDRSVNGIAIFFCDMCRHRKVSLIPCDLRKETPRNLEAELTQTKLELDATRMDLMKVEANFDIQAVKLAETRDQLRDQALKLAEVQSDLEIAKVKLAETQSELKIKTLELTTATESLGNRRNLIQLINEGVPIEIFSIIDDYGYFDIISMYRAIWNRDIDIDRVAKFISNKVKPYIISNTSVKHNLPYRANDGKHYILLSLFSERRLKIVYDYMIAYFGQSDRRDYPIDSDFKIEITLESSAQTDD